MKSRSGSPLSEHNTGADPVQISREHRTAVIVALIMAALLLFVIFFRNGTSW